MVHMYDLEFSRRRAEGLSLRVSAGPTNDQSATTVTAAARFHVQLFGSGNTVPVTDNELRNVFFVSWGLKLQLHHLGPSNVWEKSKPNVYRYSKTHVAKIGGVFTGVAYRN